MDIVKIVLVVVGSLALLLGLVWIGQGTGYFPYPRSSFMVNEMPWAYRGIGIAAAGVLIIFVSRKV